MLAAALSFLPGSVGVATPRSAWASPGLFPSRSRPWLLAELHYVTIDVAIYWQAAGQTDWALVHPWPVLFGEATVRPDGVFPRAVAKLDPDPTVAIRRAGYTPGTEPRSFAGTPQPLPRVILEDQEYRRLSPAQVRDHLARLLVRLYVKEVGDSPLIRSEAASMTISSVVLVDYRRDTSPGAVVSTGPAIGLDQMPLAEVDRWTSDALRLSARLAMEPFL